MKRSVSVKQRSSKSTLQNAQDRRLLKGASARHGILSAAEKLLARTSTSGMSMSDLVKASGIPASSIYWHFGSKEGVVAAVAEAGVQRWLGSLPGGKTLPPNGPARSRAATRAVVKSIERDSQFLKLLIKVGMELADQDHRALGVIKRARKTALELGEPVNRGFFSRLSDNEMRQASMRISRIFMALADGIVVAATIENDRKATKEMFAAFEDIAEFVLKREIKRVLGKSK